MPSFRFQSLTPAGQPREGVITAPGRAAAVRQLADRGEVATSLIEVDLEEPAPGRPGPDGQAPPALNGATARVRPAFLPGLRLPVGRVRRVRASRAEMATFVRELATAMEAGLPLMAALRTVRRQASAGMAGALDHLIDRVEAGSTLHQAAAELGPPFDDLAVGMLRAADATGKMSDVLHQLADLLDRSIELRREVLGATVYPAIVFLLILVSAVIFVTVLVPRLIAPLAGQLGQMPLPTRILLGVAEFLRAWWPWCLGIIAAGWLTWKSWARLPGNRMRIDRLKLRLPLAGRLLRDVAVARFTRTLGTLASAGIPILDALRITRGTLGNRAMMHVIDDVAAKVTGGKALAEPLERSGLFPPLLVQVVNLGERSGRLESMLLHAAGAFDRQVTSSIKLVTKALPPVLIMIMASLGAFVLAAILLPLLELQSMVR
jgi:type II secretory pathway component PulF